MTNEELLQLVRKDRPNQVIHEVLSFKKNKYGFLSVNVIMEGSFFETKVKRVNFTLPYPHSEYEKLSEKEQASYRWEPNK